MRILRQKEPEDLALVIACAATFQIPCTSATFLHEGGAGVEIVAHLPCVLAGSRVFCIQQVLDKCML